MTNITSKQVPCVLCGKFTAQDILLSTNSSGGSDLDLRPPPMKRDTMSTWLQRCDHCGFVSYDISVLPETDVENQPESLSAELVKSIIESDDYVEQFHCKSYPRLANTFLCYAMLQERGFKSVPACGWACLRAGWVCDDGVKHDKINEEKHKANAIQCRKKAIQWFEKCRSIGKPFVQQNGSEELILMDLFRRCYMFEDALKEFTRAEGNKQYIDEFVWKLLEFENLLVEQKDVDCYKVSDAQICFKKD